MAEEGNRLVITVVGMDRVGVIAALTAILADNDVNILDISQTILQGFFTMVMVVDAASSKISLSDLREKLVARGQEMGMTVTVQHEDVFKFMHRI
ncbi:MAG: ACT domain-containing protein [Methylocystaceae bacterium]